MVLGKFGNLVQGIAGNLSEKSAESLHQEYGKYLLDGETIQTGYTLIRDVIIFTDIRIIFVDKQGATGKKTSIRSFFLMNIIGVTMETAGAGFDDSEIVVHYMENIKLQAHTEVINKIKFEFPKTVDIVPLYKTLLQLAYDNRIKINQ